MSVSDLSGRRACDQARLMARTRDTVLFGAAPGMHPAVQRMFVRRMYRTITERLAGDQQWLFYNYGYVWADQDGAAPVLSPEEEPARLYVQLYRRTVLGLELSGRDVLEAGAGRATGAAHLVKTFSPRRYVALEGSPESVAFARAHHRLPGLEIVSGDATRLPFDRPSFDVVLSVEAAHAFGDDQRFFEGAARVLRSGGALRIADLRQRSELPALLRLIERAGFDGVSHHEITPQVLASLHFQHVAFEKLWHERFDAEERAELAWFVAWRDTPLLQALERGETAYVVIRALRR